MPQYGLNLNNVLEVSVIGTALVQTIENRFDVVIGGGGVANSQQLLTQMATDLNPIYALLSVNLANLGMSVRQITDAINPPPLRPRRVYGLLDTAPAQAGLSGAAVGQALTPDVTASIYLGTMQPGRTGHGRKGFGPLPITAVTIDGSHISAAGAAAFNAACAGFFNTPHNIGVTGVTYRPGLFSTTDYSRELLPKPAVSTRFYITVQVGTGLHLGTQLTRKTTPFDMFK